MTEIEQRRADTEARARLIAEAGREAVRKALIVHKALGQSIAVSEDGLVKIIPATEIVIPSQFGN